MAIDETVFTEGLMRKLNALLSAAATMKRSSQSGPIQEKWRRPTSPVMKSLSDQSVSGATMMTSIAGLPSMFATMAIARAASN